MYQSLGMPNKKLQGIYKGLLVLLELDRIEEYLKEHENIYCDLGQEPVKVGH